MLEQRPGVHRLQIKLESPCVLVVTDQYYPWWEWRVNGKKAAVFPAYGVFQGLRLPPGESLVEGVYRPPYQVLLRPGSRREAMKSGVRLEQPEGSAGTP